MKKPTLSVNKKRMGRPPVGATLVGVRFPPAELAVLDDWIAKQGDAPSRPEAIRRLVTKALGKSGPQPRRALKLLELLASSPHGATEALLVRAHGFNSDMVDSLVGDGLATAERETMKAGAKPVEVVRIRITDAGRRAIEG